MFSFCLLASSVQQSLGMLLNPIFSPLVQSQGSGGEPSGLPSNKRRYTENSNESTSSSSLTGKSSFPSSLLTVASDVAQVFANQLASVANNSSAAGTSAIVASNSSTSSSLTSGGSKSQISTCHLCGKKFQTNDYLQLHLMNKHQITGDLQSYDSLEQRLKTSNLIKASNGAVNSSTVKKIKLETTETPSSNKTSAGSPAETINSTTNSPVIPGIVDTYFAAKMADRVSCNICNKVRWSLRFLSEDRLSLFLSSCSKCVTNTFSRRTSSKFTALDRIRSSAVLHRSMSWPPVKTPRTTMNISNTIRARRSTRVLLNWWSTKWIWTPLNLASFPVQMLWQHRWTTSSAAVVTAIQVWAPIRMNNRRRAFANFVRNRFRRSFFTFTWTTCTAFNKRMAAHRTRRTPSGQVRSNDR